MSLKTSYSVSLDARIQYAQEFDHLETPMSFPQQKLRAQQNPKEHAIKVRRIYNGMMANPEIANLKEYKYLRCRNVEFPCTMEDACCFVHTQEYKDAHWLFKRSQEKATQTQERPAFRPASREVFRPVPRRVPPRQFFVPVSERSERLTPASSTSGPSSRSSVPSSSPSVRSSSPVERAVSASSSIVSAPPRVMPTPAPSAFKAPVMNQPQILCPPLGIPLEIIDDAGYAAPKWTIMSGLNIDLRGVFPRG